MNCRILPGHSPEEVRQQLIKVLADPAYRRYVADNGEIADSLRARGLSAPPLSPVMKPLERLVVPGWPDVKFPTWPPGPPMPFIRVPPVCRPTPSPASLSTDDTRAHGRDERLGVASFYKANEFFYRYLKAVTSP